MSQRLELPARVSAAMQRLDELVAHFEQHPEATVREQFVEALQCVDVIHRAGIQRLAQLLRQANIHPAAPEIELLFQLYDAFEGGELSRAELVLKDLRETIESRGGSLRVTAAADGMVAMELTGNFGEELAPALREQIETTLRELLPGFEQAEIAYRSTARPPSFVPIASLRTSPRISWHEILPGADVPAGAVRPVEADGQPILLTRVDGEVFAYRDQCPGTPFPLRTGTVEEGRLRCPYHGCLFDLRGGRRVDRPGVGLGVVPVREEAGQVCIGILSGAAA